jgi:hypothetical protein
MSNIEKLLAELNERVNSGCKVWHFQASPKTRYIVQDRLKRVKVGDLDVWDINQHKKEVFNGHLALIGSCGEKAGIYALADVISPEMLVDSQESTKHYIREEDRLRTRLRVKIKFSLILGDKYITGEDLNRKSRQGTNFPVTKSEWRTISSIIRKIQQEC